MDAGPAEREAMKADLIGIFRQNDASQFDLASYAQSTGITLASAAEVAEDLYAKFVRKVASEVALPCDRSTTSETPGPREGLQGRSRLAAGAYPR